MPVRGCAIVVTLLAAVTAALLLTTTADAEILDAAWSAPIVNADGSALTDLGSYRLYYGISPTPCPGSSFVSVPSSSTTPTSGEIVSVRLSGLSSGTVYYASITALDLSGNESACSPAVSAIPRSDFVVSPAGTVAFGSVSVGSFSEQTFTVENTGGGTLSGTASVPLPFSIVSGASFTLAGVGATQNVKVRFSPTVGASVTANLTFRADGGVVSRVLTGTGTIVDTAAPNVAVTAPTGGTVSGTIAITATATDDVGVVGVQFKVDGANVGAEDTVPPYSVSWKTSLVPNGVHTVSAVARDAAGNLSTSSGITVIVANDVTPPQLSQPAPSAISSSSATLTWTTDEASTSQIQYGATTAYGTTSPLDATRKTAHSVTVAGLSPNTLYHMRARSRDAAGNLGVSVDVTLRTLPADVTPPVVTITAPDPGAMLRGVVTVTVAATDDVGVAAVQIAVDGAALGGQLTALPYALTWDTTLVSDGLHTITAVARDLAGNAVTSAPVPVTVTNGVLRLVPHDTSLLLNAANYSAHPLLMTYTWPDRGVANAIVMKFDVSSLPAGSVVQSATLSLALVESDATADSHYRVGVHKIIGKDPVIAAASGYTIDGVTGWTPNACCSGNIPLAQADISVAYDTQLVDKAPGYKSWTITGMVQEWVAAPATNFGLLLNSDTAALADRYRYFASAEHTDTSLRPVLRITYVAATPPDRTPPAVSLTSPLAGIVSGVVTVAATATDDAGIAGVQFELDGATLGAESTAAPYHVVWDTTGTPDGPHTLTAVARDVAGNAAATSLIVTVHNGVVRLSPQDTSLLLDAKNYSTHPLLMTYTWPDRRVANAVLMKFDLSALPAGAVVQTASLHLALVERDGTADPTYAVSVHKVTGTNPSIVGATGYSSDGVASWIANACCFSGVPLAQADISAVYDTQSIDGQPGYKAWTITSMVQEWVAAPATNFGLLLNSDASALADRYRFFASAEHPDAALRPFLRITYAMPGSTDTTSPTVAITTPAPAATVAGTVALTAMAGDDVGVAGLQFEVDGAPLGTEIRSAPFTVMWDTTVVSDGAHTLTAVARDANGNVTRSPAVPVSVTNGSMVVSVAPTDTFINVNATNYSASSLLATYTWPDNQPANAILLTFDLSSVPTDAIVHEATLQLSLVDSDTTSDAAYTVTAHKIVGRAVVTSRATGYTADGVTPWTANACCHASVPLAQADISAAYDSRAIDKVRGEKSWTVTRMVQEWLAEPGTNRGMLLNSDGAALRDRYRTFASTRHVDVPVRPYLKITYSLRRAPLP
jgi:hypothetical protein